jgi:hypothetical protein
VAGAAPGRVIATRPTYLRRPLRRLRDDSHPPTPEGSLPACAWSDVALRRNPYPHHYSTAFAFSLLLYLLPRRLALRLAFPRPPWCTGQGRQQAYHVPPMYLSGKAASARRWLDICAAGVRGLRTWPPTFWSKRFSSLRLFLVTTPAMLYLGWPFHPILVPDHLAAGSRSDGAHLGCPPEGGGYVVPGLILPVGYRWQNSGYCQPAPQTSVQLHRRPRVARERPGSRAGPLVAANPIPPYCGPVTSSILFGFLQGNGSISTAPPGSTATRSADPARSRRRRDRHDRSRQSARERRRPIVPAYSSKYPAYSRRASV